MCIRDSVSIGHNAIIHGCTIDDFVLVGMGSIVMDRSKISSNTIIAAGSVVKENTFVEPNSIYGGIPAKKIKDIDQSKSKKEIERIAKNYLIYSKWYKYCLLYTSPSPRDLSTSRMPSSA